MERLHELINSRKREDSAEFKRIISNSDDLLKVAKLLTSDLDFFVKILRNDAGSNRILSILGKSEEIDWIFFYPITKRMTEIITQRRGYFVASRILKVCNPLIKKLFVHNTFYHALAFARDGKGCMTLKRVITEAEDRYKGFFLDLIADEASFISMDDVGISLIQHVLELEFTRKTTEATRLHALMNEFDEILSSSNIVELHKLTSKLTSDSDLFLEFVKTRRGSLMVQIILGKSEEIDMMFLEAIKQRFTDVITDKFGYSIVLRTENVFIARGNFEVQLQVLRLIEGNALYLTKDPVGNKVVQEAIDLNNYEDYTFYVAARLHNHYIELSFQKFGSNVVEKLLGNCKSLLALGLTVKEILACDEDTLMRLAKDEYGNNVLKKTLEVAKERKIDWFGDLVEKLKPFLDSLRGSQGENVAAVIDSETVIVKDEIASDGNS